MKNKSKIDELKIRAESFSDLKENWDGYGADEISVKSIITTNKVLDGLLAMNINIDDISIYPMTDGGIQIDIGDFKEIEIKDELVSEIRYNHNYDISCKVNYSIPF